MGIRSYDDDWQSLWALKRAFERELGTTGSAVKAATYENKLTPTYRDRYREWVGRCLADDSDCIQVAIPEDGDEPVGYVFVLPETHAMIWDAGVVNELYLAPSHRASGLADDLMTAAMDVIRGQSLPLERVILDVASDNERARAVYERHGFEPWAALLARSVE